MRYCLNHEELSQVKQDLISMTEMELREKYDEVYLRRALSFEALCTTAGKRPSTVGNIKLKELREAKVLENGNRDVLVHEHKTQHHGPSHLIFYREGLYEACKRFAAIFNRKMTTISSVSCRRTRTIQASGSPLT